MKNVIIYSDHSKGHLIPTFYIAKQLEDSGYKVYYVGIEETVKEVKKLGFNSYSIFRDEKAKLQNPLERILQGELDEIVKEIKPKIILVTVFNILETFFFYYKYKIKVAFLWSHFPENNAQLHLSRYSKFLKDRLGAMFLEESNADNFLMLINHIAGLGHKIDTLEDIISPLNEFAHFITLSKELLIQQDLHFDNEVYLGPCVFDKNLFDVNDEFLKNELKLPHYFLDNHKIIYCSLGTSSTQVDAIKSLTIFSEIIKCANSEMLKGYQFIIACGGLIDSLKKQYLNDNVHLYEWVPQIEVLKYSSLACIHGGMGSIKECIIENTPMLITPLGRDQFYNAKLISHHNLGVEVDINQIKNDELLSIMQNILKDTEIKENLRNMKTFFDSDGKEKKGLKYINEIFDKEEEINISSNK